MPFFCIQKDTRKKHEAKKIDSNSKKEFLLCVFKYNYHMDYFFKMHINENKSYNEYLSLMNRSFKTRLPNL